MRKKIIGLIFICLLIGCGIGYTIGNYSVVDTTERYFVPPNHNHSEVPPQIDSQITDAPDFYSFDQVSGEPVFERVTHDAMVVEEEGTYYMIVGTTRSEGQRLYSTKTPEDASSWKLEDAEYLSETWEFDSIIKKNDEYLIYGNGDIYKADSVATDNWKKVADNTEFSDAGAYYDNSTDTVHVYYEVSDIAGYSGKKIGHATSPNGVNNWTVYPAVWEAQDGYGLGDFDVVKQNSTVYILGDYDEEHPRYNISVWASDNFYDGFTQKDKSVIGYDNQDVEYGVGDPTLIKYQGKCLVFANMHENLENPPSVHLYKADCSSKV